MPRLCCSVLCFLFVGEVTRYISVTFCSPHALLADARVATQAPLFSCPQTHAERYVQDNYGAHMRKRAALLWEATAAQERQERAHLASKSPTRPETARERGSRVSNPLVNNPVPRPSTARMPALSVAALCDEAPAAKLPAEKLPAGGKKGAEGATAVGRGTSETGGAAEASKGGTGGPAEEGAAQAGRARSATARSRVKNLKPIGALRVKLVVDANLFFWSLRRVWHATHQRQDRTGHPAREACFQMQLSSFSEHLFDLQRKARNRRESHSVRRPSTCN